jgi:hypothetical protein
MTPLDRHCFPAFREENDRRTLLAARVSLSLAHAAIGAAAGIGIAVPVVLTIGAIGLSALILVTVASAHSVSFFGVEADLQTTLFAVLWAVYGVVVLFTVGGALQTAGKARKNVPLQRSVPTRHLRDERSSVPVEAKR